ncbi:unnamed protein product [Phaedon cochleariae]|uniref:Pheromone biosynthesis activating neuropeptide n=1 Tax=Phaedon cochleariae TaxID=80249 RepID=A0A9P0GX84_PHACE|nr:unnamed protein product [Phaedon cochleariae]
MEIRNAAGVVFHSAYPVLCRHLSEFQKILYKCDLHSSQFIPVGTAKAPKMSKISLITFSAIFLFLYFKSGAGDDLQEKRNDDPNYSPLWFGPRVGRRKRNLMEDGYKSNVGKEEVEVLLDLIRKSPWTIVLFSNGRTHYLNFDPKSSSDDVTEEQITNLVQRSMFAPRLGRSMFAPRLGRDTVEMGLE